jgi:hypothetical protein
MHGYKNMKQKTLDRLLDSGQYNKEIDPGERNDDVNWFIPVQ